MKYDRAVAVAATVHALRKLVAKESREQLEAADRHLAGTAADVTVHHKQ